MRNWKRSLSLLRLCQSVRQSMYNVRLDRRENVWEWNIKMILVFHEIIIHKWIWCQNWPMSCANNEYNALKMVNWKDQWREKKKLVTYTSATSTVPGIRFYFLIHWNWFQNVKIFVEKWINEFRSHGIDNDWMTFRNFFLSLPFSKNQTELWLKLISGFVILLQCHLNNIMYYIKLFLSLRIVVCAFVLFLFSVQFCRCEF